MKKCQKCQSRHQTLLSFFQSFQKTFWKKLYSQVDITNILLCTSLELYQSLSWNNQEISTHFYKSAAGFSVLKNHSACLLQRRYKSCFGLGQLLAVGIDCPMKMISCFVVLLFVWYFLKSYTTFSDVNCLSPALPRPNLQFLGKIPLEYIAFPMSICWFILTPVLGVKNAVTLVTQNPTQIPHSCLLSNLI